MNYTREQITQGFVNDLRDDNGDCLYSNICIFSDLLSRKDLVQLAKELAYAIEQIKQGDSVEVALKGVAEELGGNGW